MRERLKLYVFEIVRPGGLRLFLLGVVHRPVRLEQYVRSAATLRQSLASSFILWHIFAPMMKTGKRSPNQHSLTRQYRSTASGRRFHRFVTAVVALATLIFLLVMGPVAEPDFWQLESLVRLGANFIFYTAILHPALSPVGYIGHILLSSIEAAVALSRDKAATLPPPQAYFSGLPERFSPNNASLSLASVNHQAHIIAHLSRKQHPRLRSTNKAPFGLFMQAVSLLAP